MSHVDDNSLDDALRALGPGGRPITSAADILARAAPPPVVAPRGLAGGKLAAVIFAAAGAGFIGGVASNGGQALTLDTHNRGQTPAIDTSASASKSKSESESESESESMSASGSKPAVPSGSALRPRSRPGVERRQGSDVDVARNDVDFDVGKIDVDVDVGTIDSDVDIPAAPALPKRKRVPDEDAVATVRDDDPTPFHVVAAAGLAFLTDTSPDAPPVGAQLDVKATWTPVPTALSPEASLGVSLAPHGAAVPSELRIGAGAGARYNFGVVAPALAWNFAVVPAGLLAQGRAADLPADPPSPWQTGPALDVRFGPEDGLALHTAAALDLGLPHPGKPVAVGGHVEVGVSIPLGGARNN